MFCCFAVFAIPAQRVLSLPMRHKARQILSLLAEDPVLNVHAQALGFDSRAAISAFSAFT